MDDKLSETGLTRLPFELFYTKKEVAELCYNKAKEVINYNQNDLIIEPSAGTGEFSELIRHEYKNLSYDTIPKKDYIIKKDFLSVDLNELKTQHGIIHILEMRK